MILLGAFAGLAVLLASVGIYGVISYSVARRGREIGIRMALGASRETTALLILRDTARMAAVGIVFGFFLAIAATRLETSVLFGARPLDTFSLTCAIGVLSSAILLAAWLPARRAASIDPMQALRSE